MFSYHTHTFFCDGKASVDDFCEMAIKNGFAQLAFTSHAPVPFTNNYSLAFEKLFRYRDTVLEAKHRYSGQLDVLLGLEADFIPDTTIDFDQWRRLIQPDFIVGSVHFVKDDATGKNWFIDGAPHNFEAGLEEVFDGDIERAVRLYFKQVRTMLGTQKPEIVGHIDKVKMNNRDIYFKTHEKWYCDELAQTFECVKQHGAIVEINSRGVYRGKYHQCFPHIDGIQICMELGIPLTLASDAHQPEELRSGFELSKQIAVQAGLRQIAMFDNGTWKSVEIDSL
ncbi:MAG: histidinol-phosphatase [Breznakibacter sp.]